jgi:hypothetical protein
MTNPVDAIVRLVESDEKPSEPGDVRVIVDPAGPKVVSPGMFTGMRRSLQHYIVNAQKSVVRTGLVVALRSRKGSLKLRVSYEARCRKDQESQLAMGVARSKNPQLEIDQVVGRAAEEFGMERLIDGYPDSIGELAAIVGQSAEELLGLELQLDVEPGAGELDPHSFGPITLNVRPHDTNVQLAVTLEGVLEVDPGRKLQAHIKQSQLEVLTERLARAADSFFRLEVTLHQLFVGLNSTLPLGLINATTELVASHGRRLTAVVMRCDFSKQVEAFKHVVARKDGHYAFEYNNPRYPGPIQVKASYNMHLIDVGRFIRSGVVDLDRWMADCVQETSHNVLFKISHEELCTSFAESKKRIESEMEVEAKRIGYALDHFFAVTDHQIDRFQRGTELRPVRATLALKSDEQVKVTLTVVVALQISDFSKILEKVKHNETVAQDMEQEIGRVMAQELRGITPEEFCRYFESPRPPRGDTLEEQPPVATQLETAIRRRLKKEYLANVQRVDFTGVETELRQVWLDLTGTTSTVEFAASPVGSVPIQFSMQFHVQAVDEHGWHDFQRTKPKLEDVKAGIRDQLEAELSAISPQDLGAASEDLLGYVKAATLRRTRAQFGLLVQLMTLRRINSTVEVQEALDLEQAALEAIERQKVARGLLRAREGQRATAEARDLEQIQSAISRYRREYEEALMDGDEAKAKIIKDLQNAAIAERDQIMKAAKSDGFETPLDSATKLGSGRAPFALPARVRRLAELDPSAAKAPELVSSNAGGSDVGE